MASFQEVLETIINNHKIPLKDLAEAADITASYISNLKRGKRNLPSVNVLNRLVDALEKQFQVSRQYLQPLIASAGYSWDQFKMMQQAERAQSLLNNIGTELETRGVAEAPRKQSALSPEQLRQLTSRFPGYLKGDRRLFIQKGIELLEIAAASSSGGRIFVKTPYLPEWEKDPGLEALRTRFRDLLRNLLWPGPDSIWEVYNLWFGGSARNFGIFKKALSRYMGTANYTLFQLPIDQPLPGFLVIEGLGAVIGLPNDHQQIAISSFLAGSEKQYLFRVGDLVQYLEHLLGPEELRKPIIQTEATRDKIFSEKAHIKLMKAEKDGTAGDKVIMKPKASAAYRPLGPLAAKLRAQKIPAEKLNRYLEIQEGRMAALETLRREGKSRCIHSRQAFLKEFQYIAQAYVENQQHEQAEIVRLEAAIRKGQIMMVLQDICQREEFHYGFVEQDFPMHFELSGETAFFAYEDPQSSTESDLQVFAWADHPDIVHQVKKEFDTDWNQIEDIWRTTKPEGRVNVANWIISEFMAALLNHDVALDKVMSTLQEILLLIDVITDDDFSRLLYQKEQMGKDILAVVGQFPAVTMTHTIGPWKRDDPVRTRQLVFRSILQEDIEKYHIVCLEPRIRDYWENFDYGMKEPLKKEWVEKHFANVIKLLQEFPEKMHMEVLPIRNILVNFEVVNERFVFLEAAGPDEKRHYLDSIPLAKALKSYVQKHLSPQCDPSRRGAANVVKWLQQEFGAGDNASRE